MFLFCKEIQVVTGVTNMIKSIFGGNYIKLRESTWTRITSHYDFKLSAYLHVTLHLPP